MKTIEDYLLCVVLNYGYAAYWFPKTFIGLKMCALSYEMLYDLRC